MAQKKHRGINLIFSMSLFWGAFCSFTTFAQAQSKTAEIIEQLTGDHPEIGGVDLRNDTSYAKVHGTDMGIPFYDPSINAFFIAFGDTFGPDSYPAPNWDWCDNPDTPGNERCYTGSSALAVTFDTDPSNGMPFMGFLLNYYAPLDYYYAKEVVARNANNYNAIPMSGYADLGRQYLWIADVLWFPLDFAGARLAYSDDYWSTSNSVEITGSKTSNFGITTMMYRAEDDYIYLFGTKAYRIGPIQLARVPRASLKEDPNKINTDIEYYAPQIFNSNCYDNNNWSTNRNSAVNIGGMFAGELSVTYNKHLNAYLLLYLEAAWGSIYMSTAPTPCGPWTWPILAVNCAESDKQQCYGSYMIPKVEDYAGRKRYYTEKDVYFIMSRMTPESTLTNTNGPGFDGCESVQPGDPCHEVYNTFLMKLELDDN
jgi:hypothetical protein